MNIVCYSPVIGQGCVSSSLAAIAGVCYFQYQKSILMMQSQWRGSLDGAFLKKRGRESENYFATTGIDEWMRLVKAKDLSLENLYRGTISLDSGKESLDLLTGSTKLNRELFQDDFCSTISDMLALAELKYHMTFLDTGQGSASLRKLIFAKADLVLVFLPQNKRVIDQYLSKSTDNSKCCYIISRYDPDSIYNLFYLRCHYPVLRKKLIGTVPYNVEYMDAWSRGKALDFLRIHGDSHKIDSNGYFIKELTKIANRLQKEVFDERSETA